jgi:hypothetical protein
MPRCCQRIIFLVGVIARLALVYNTVAAGGQDAVIAAGIGVNSVSIITLLTGIKDTVAADGQLTIGLAAVTIYVVAIITLLARVYNTVATAWEFTVGLAAVTVYIVSIVTFLIHIVYYRVTAVLIYTGCRTPVSACGVSIIALFTRLYDTVTAGFGTAA